MLIMKKFKNLWYALAGVAIACVLLFATWWCSSSKLFDRVSVTPIPETELTIVKSERDYSTPNDIAIVTYFYLMNKGDTLASGCYDFNPYVNVRGVVYIPKQGIYDCRKGRIAKILPLETDTNLEMVAVEGKDKLLIIVGSPFWNLKEMVWDNSRVKQYEYDLKKCEISEL